MPASPGAKGIRPPRAPAGPPRPTAGRPLDRLSPSLEAEAGAALERALVRTKAETIGAACDRKRSSVYQWAAHPETIPLGALPVIAGFDPDPEFMSRMAGHLLQWVAARALRRQVDGGIVTVLHNLGIHIPHGADPETVRRLTGQGMEGDD